MTKYTIGVDFGSLSGRAVLVEVESGRELLSCIFDYPHAVMDKELPDGTKLGVDWALQHPQDYLDALSYTIPELIRQTGISPNDIIGIGTDFTACTVLPVKADGTPLCFLDEFRSNPHAYVKLWKHHAAQDKANQLNEIALQRKEEWLKRYGGKISSEWEIPKLWQILDEAPEIYEAMDYFVEAADWIIWQLTGVQTRNSCTAGYKAMWHKKDGYPPKEFFKALDPRLENVIADKLSCPVTALGEKAGMITEKAAKLTGLKPGTAVAVGNVDAHVTVPAVKIDGCGKILAIMGTSTCHVLLSNEEKMVPGMCGVVQDGILPGFFGYEAGQSCVGDHFEWFVKECLPVSYWEEAREKAIDIHQFLTEKAARLSAGESGLLALDWWNGNRSVLVDVDLTGMMLGMTLQTKPEEMYRALIEATAFGTRKIIETFRQSGVPVNEFYASGGISQKNSLAMHIYADVINLPIKIAGSTQGPALGAAIFGAVAAGKEAGGYNSVFDATKKMGKLRSEVYLPNPKNVAVYNQLYAEYHALHDYFGRGTNDVMKHLKKIKKAVVQDQE
ncbi:L-ribulokinase [Sporomusaceae bacterium BoRhaA]|uniref:ribulokinase n=1 Tax=Pelorhabdus rhamnosifermentans TaxID=2772457 RepID=UPI001C0630FA|nr:ribulokinase [Pelorhabdus rhamnosifermentans]MBU2702742.1 L-ribulokinase [Pelorhabdus rhamnosifermentans]